MKQDWINVIIDKIGVDDLPEDYQTMANIIGVENTIKLSNHLGGMAFYYRKIESLLSAKRNELIRSEFNGANHRELARKYRISGTWVREILKEKSESSQADLFSGAD